MPRSFTLSMILSVVAVLSLSLTVAARSDAFDLLAGDTLQISCAGKLTLNQTSDSQAAANCENAVDNALAVTALVLIDADADQDIKPLAEGDILDWAKLPSRNINVRADTNPAVVGSVRFELNGPENSRFENVAPYTLAGDSKGDYNALTLPAGKYSLKAIPYTNRNGGGVAGTALTVNFTVVDGQDDGTGGGGEPAPTATPTTVPGGTNPSAGSVPACPDHDPTQWHGLYDAQRDCHYDHTHNSDPNDPLALQLFGSPGAAWGQELSYPWQTWGNASAQVRASEDVNGKARLGDVQYDGSTLENSGKHQGYKYNVNFEFNDVMPQIGGFGYLKPAGFIHGWRTQYHVVGGSTGAKTRFHSFYTELYSCSQAVRSPDPAKCGIIKAGGWGDFGILHVPYKAGHFPLPTDPPAQTHFTEPYRSAESEAIAGEIVHGRNLVSTWATDHHRQWGWNNHVSYVFRIHDEPGYFKQGTYVDVCRDSSGAYTCGYNGTRHSFETFIAYVDSKFDQDKDGYADFKGYTDRQGNINTACTVVGLDCIPYELNHAPVGWNVFQQKEGITPNHVKDFDLCASGGKIGPCPLSGDDNIYDKGILETIGWIKHPN